MAFFLVFFYFHFFSAKIHFRTKKMKIKKRKKSKNTDFVKQNIETRSCKIQIETALAFFERKLSTFL